MTDRLMTVAEAMARISEGDEREIVRECGIAHGWHMANKLRALFDAARREMQECGE